MLLPCWAIVCLSGCVTTKTVYVPVPCKTPVSLSQPSEALPLLKQLDLTLKPSSVTLSPPVPATLPDSKMPWTGPRQ